MLAGIPVTDDDTPMLAEFLRHAEFPTLRTNSSAD